MSLNLEKGQKVNITAGTGIQKIYVGTGWDVGNNFDLDAMTFSLNKDGKCTSPDDFVYFGTPKINGVISNASGSIIHNGDNLTGAGDGDDEVMTIDLPKIPATTEKIVVAICIYKAIERKHNFGMVKNAFGRIVNFADNKEFLKYDLSEDYSTATSVIVGEIYRNNGEWKFAAIGEGKKLEIGDLAKLYGLS
jgi:tellurium resistance protein TerD